MVRLHVKHGDESQFLFDTTVDVPVEELVEKVAAIYNGRLKVSRICSEMEELAEHGILMPTNMQGLTDEQIEELKLEDEWETKCVPSGGSVFKKDEIGRRNGHAPNDNMKKVFQKTMEEAKALVSKKQVEANVCVTQDMVKDALDQLRGAVMIVYPMGLPPHDPIRMEFENNEDLSGTQCAREIQISLAVCMKAQTDWLRQAHNISAGQMVIKEPNAQLWWAGKELLRKKKLADYVGKNEKTKIIVKIQTRGQGAPAREPVISEEEQKKLMLHYHRRREEFKKLEEDEDLLYLNTEWADTSSLKRQFQGVKDIKWRPR